MSRAERRLQSAFPEVWAWYELLVTARRSPSSDPPLDDPHRPDTRKLA